MTSLRCAHLPSMLSELKSVNVLMIVNPLNVEGMVEAMGSMDESKRERGGRVNVRLNDLVDVSVFVPRSLYPVMCFGASEWMGSLPIPSLIDWVIGTRCVISKEKEMCESLLNGLKRCGRDLNLKRVFYRGSPLKKVNDLFGEVELDGGCFDWCGECEVCGKEVINSMKEWKGKKYGVGM